DELGDGRVVRKLEGGEAVPVWADGEEEGDAGEGDDEGVANVEEVGEGNGVVVDVVVVVVVDEVDETVVEVAE
ncbi:MAG: hypothetical protein Q9187_006389, partial [Circinaria calcarea]